MKVTGRLEGWMYDKVCNIIWGHIYDDARKRFHNGQWIHTSDIVDGRTRKFKEGDVIETLNSRYLLGKALST